MSYAAKYSFETPLSLPTFGKKVKEEAMPVQKKEKMDASTADEEEEEEDVEDPVHVTFNAGIAGNIVHRRQRATAQFEDGTEEEMQVSLGSPSTIFELHSNIF